LMYPVNCSVYLVKFDLNIRINYYTITYNERFTIYASKRIHEGWKG
jgi:hypothetical protein